MKFDTFGPVRELERAVSLYTGAPYVVTVNSCTMALLLAMSWYKQKMGLSCVNIPRRTYVSVPMSAKHAGLAVRFRDEEWKGFYRLEPAAIWDSARYFSQGMYDQFRGGMVCVSFHVTKVLGDTQGGAILLDNREAYEWLKRMRFDGRTEGVAPKDDQFNELGYHCYMSPDVAARLVHRLAVLPNDNDPLPNDEYPDLSLWGIFK